ncbi:hypothetical protein G1C95_1024 [Bifidobacterium sp. DSM 109957]|uniref:Uncharacterized protein n=1 Tax=Bifidobacterium oedipodis TaxID=2675322 RepID=A0A7Y0EP47_9BIFI|nr:hypothetical protein [Bifidobacterium sp. DSM 109957]
MQNIKKKPNRAASTIVLYCDTHWFNTYGSRFATLIRHP